MTSTTDFDYHLPPESIAQTPAEPRESANLMVVDRKTYANTHHHVLDLPTFFHSGDVIVINNTKVFKCRLFGTIQTASGILKTIELFLVKPITATTWMALLKPGKACTVDMIISIADQFQATILEKHTDGTVIVSFPMETDRVIDLANVYGHVPNPPYIKTEPTALQYQTSYAKVVGSVAAPTAGFHLTPAIRKAMLERGVTFVEITLHVGLGTFLPIKSDSLDTHVMHAEWVSVSKESADTINAAKQEHRRVIAIGTTTVRTLEGVAQAHHGTLQPFSGDINIFICPGFHFSVIDGMLTNFHLPKSTLLVLVSAFVNRETILRCYLDAIASHFRFYSFGDAMLII